MLQVSKQPWLWPRLTSNMKFADIEAANEVVVIAGLTFTAGASGASSADLAAAFATGAPVPSLVGA